MSYQEKTIDGRLMWTADSTDEWLPHPLDTQIRHALGPHNNDAEPVVYLVAGLVAELSGCQGEVEYLITRQKELVAEVCALRDELNEWRPTT